MRYVFVVQDYKIFITSQKRDCKLFKMRWKWYVCFSDIRYLSLL